MALLYSRISGFDSLPGDFLDKGWLSEREVPWKFS